MRVFGGGRLSFGVALGLFGCGTSGSGAGGMAGAGGSAGTGGTAGAGGSGGSPGSTATVSGTVGVGDDGSTVPVEGATVLVVGTSISVTTDGSGSWSLEAPEGEVYLQASASGFWSSIVRRDVPTEGLIDVELEVVPDALVEGIGSALGRTIDEAKGIAALGFDTIALIGGQTATLSKDADFSFAFDGAGDPQRSNALISGGDSDLIFVGVELTAALTVTPEGASETEFCSVRFGATPPILARSITEVDVPCSLSLAP